MPDAPPETMGELERLARERFTDPPLTDAEIKLVRNAPVGKMADCAPRTDITRPAALSGEDEKWGPERQVRPTLIRWLCVEPRARVLIDPLGIRLWSAQVQGWLDLSFVTIPFPLCMVNCRLLRDINLEAAEIPDLNLHGTSVPGMEASGIHVKANLFLRTGFTSSGEVRLLGARIGGDLDCSGATFLSSGPSGGPGGGIALSADRIEVGNGVFLNKRFRAEGEVRFPGARIGGDLSCSGGTFINPPKAGGSGCALETGGMTVGGDVFLSEGFRSEGEIRLVGAQIGGNLDCSGARFASPAQTGVPESGKAFCADGAVVKGCIFFRDGFSAEGDVELLGADVEKNLECISSRFRGRLGMRGISIRGGFHWLDIKNPELATLLLDDASASRILDEIQSWPTKGNLDLDGFVYQRIAQGPRDHQSRLNWLSRQQDFAPQPYRQLAKVLREEGDDSGARKVLFEMERLRRVQGSPKWYQRLWSVILRGVVGYGYYPVRALKWLVVVILAGFLFFWLGYAARSMSPTDEDAYREYRDVGHTPAHYERFHALIYSLENTAPLVKLGQVDRWQPDPNPQRFVECLWARSSSFSICVSLAGFLRWVRWIQTLLGWILATFFVAGVTGIVRKD